MNNIEFYHEIIDLFGTYKIGNVIKEPKSISGGLMHKMYMVITETNIYAVKWLNPSIMKRKGALYNMINSEIIASIFSEQLPVVEALKFDGHNVLQWNNNYYIIFHWMKGVSIFPPFISQKNCYEIGRALGRMHQLDITVPNIKKDANNAIIYNWGKFLVDGREQKADWIDTYSNVSEKLTKWNHCINEAKGKLSKNMVISHRDLDPKNVMWYQDMPYFIDWESAGYVNPYQELLEVLSYWTSNENGVLDKNKFKTLLSAYREYMSTDMVNWDDVLSSRYAGMLGWLEYNLKRALGIESGDEEEKILGAKEVIGAIKDLERYDNQLQKIKSWAQVV